MKHLRAALIILSLLTFFTTLPAQKYTRGNLLRVNMFGNEINQSDTLLGWSSIEDSNYFNAYNYYGSVLLNGQKYFLKFNEIQVDRQYSPQHDYLFSLVNSTGSVENLYSRVSVVGWDIMEPFMYKESRLFKVESGVWLINGAYGTAFVDNNGKVISSDSIAILEKSPADFRIIAGEINGVNVAVSFNFNGPNVYFAELSTFARIDSISRLAVDYFGDPKFIVAPSHLEALNDSLYLATLVNSNEFFLCKYSDDTLHLTKKLSGYSGEEWHLTDNKIHSFFANVYRQYQFDSLYNSIQLLNKLGDWQNAEIRIDFNYKFCAAIVNNILKIWRLQPFELINTFDLSTVKNASRPFIDSPYVYIHQETTTVGIEESSAEKLDFRLSAYPNPFNAVSNLEYVHPKGGSFTAAVFNSLGQEIRVLKSGYAPGGTYRWKFNGSGLPSGVYYFSVQNEARSSVIKLLYLK